MSDCAYCDHGCCYGDCDAPPSPARAAVEARVRRYFPPMPDLTGDQIQFLQAVFASVPEDGLAHKD